jgi:hypothetical protein
VPCIRLHTPFRIVPSTSPQPSNASSQTSVLQRVVVGKGPRPQGPNGYTGDGFSSSIELVAVPVLFIVGGLALDRWMGTRWIFAAALGAFAIAGTIAKQYYVYTARMKSQEESLRSSRAELADLHAQLHDAKNAELAAEQAELAAHLAANRPTDAIEIGAL